MQLRLGQNSFYVGNGIWNDIVVLRVGFEPGAFGSVLIFSTESQFGQTKDLIGKLINAFFTGNIPGD